MLPDLLLVDMVPKVITALRLTTELLWVISWDRGSKTLRPSRHTLLFSPYNRDKSKMKHSPWWMENWKIIMKLLIYQNISHIKCIMRKLDFFLLSFFFAFLRHAVPFSANVRIPLQALTTMSSSEELNNSTAVAGVLISTVRATNWL